MTNAANETLFKMFAPDRKNRLDPQESVLQEYKNRVFPLEPKKEFLFMPQNIADSESLRRKRLDSLRLGLYSTMVSGKYGTGKAV